jgi:hypothetical protein
MNDPFAPLAGSARHAPASTAWTLIVPVPEDAPSPPTRHPKLGEHAASWPYTDAAGRLLGYARRFESTEGKEFRPLTLWRPTTGGKPEWRWESWPLPRPLYGLCELAAARPDAPVVVVEGEKACDAARRLLSGFVVVTSPNGSKSASKADWSPLRGRNVIAWPDTDPAGLDYARGVVGAATRAGAKSAFVVSPPPAAKPGWDAADALAEGWDEARTAALISSAKPFTEPSADPRRAETPDSDDAPESSGSRRRTPQRDVLIGLTEFVELWHDANRNAHASFQVGGHHENWPIRSREFRMWLSARFFEQTGGAIGGQALEDGIRILEARAVNEGPQYDCFVRTGYFDGKMYIDLGDPTWRAVEITAPGWRVIEKSPIKFLRSPSMRPLPEPQAGSLIEELRRFLNVSDRDWVLVVAWIVAALRHRGPFPILVVNAEAGTAKSFLSRIVRSLVDPGAAPLRAMPKDDRDLVVSASNSWVLAFDNLSSVPTWFADALCRLATGSGFATRMLHTDRDEMIFEAARPIIINGIPRLTDAADLADRTVTIHPLFIPDEARRPEDELWSEFEQAWPRIFGAFLDALSRALGNIASVRLDRTPRMADFAKWITAAEPGLGWELGTFLEAYRENRRDVSEAAFEADAVAVAIDKLISSKGTEGFEGTPTELLSAINNMVEETVRKSKYWPQDAARLGNRFAKATKLLRDKGYSVKRWHSGSRHIEIIPARRA